MMNEAELKALWDAARFIRSKRPPSVDTFHSEADPFANAYRQSLTELICKLEGVAARFEIRE